MYSVTNIIFALNRIGLHVRLCSNVLGNARVKVNQGAGGGDRPSEVNTFSVVTPCLHLRVLELVNLTNQPLIRSYMGFLSDCRITTESFCYVCKRITLYRPSEVPQLTTGVRTVKVNGSAADPSCLAALKRETADPGRFRSAHIRRK